MRYMRGDFTQPETFSQLGKLLVEQRERQTDTANVLFYLAVADRFFGPVIEQLGRAGLTRQSERAWRRVIVEKPFGHDLASAEALNAQILKVLSEDQIYRIDHFLGKETVQNILVLRFANGIFEPLWNRDHIDHVQITAAETVGVEGRGRFYERTGALRDMVPNHLFQLLAMIAMEPPISFDADAVRAKKTELFQAIHPVSPENAVRGQYGAGWCSAEKFGTTGTSPTSRRIPQPKPMWRSSSASTIGAGPACRSICAPASTFPHARPRSRCNSAKRPTALFRDTPVERLPPNILTLRIQPDEGLSISFSAKRPGSEIEIDGVAMDFAYRDYFEPLAAVGYETLIYDCLIGDATLFQRADTVEAAWRAVQGLLDSWARDPARDFPELRRRQRRPRRRRSAARARWTCMAADQGQPPTHGHPPLIVARNNCGRGDTMKATQTLHDLGQSLWLDNITRNLLKTGVLRRYIDELSVTGLTSNPTIFDHAIKNSNDYDDAIKSKLAEGKSGEKLFFELALEDLTQAADLFRPVYDRTCGVDGWVSLEVSPLLAHDTKSTIAVAKDLHARARRPNLLIKIPGTPEGLPAIEEAIFAGVPVNVTLLFSDDQYLAAADAFMRGIERRIDAGLQPDVGSVASIFISRWDVAVAGKVPEALNNQLGIAVAKRTYKAYLDLLSSPRWMRAYNAGARPQRLLWASTGTKDPKASDDPLHQGPGRTIHREHHA